MHLPNIPGGIGRFVEIEDEPQEFRDTGTGPEFVTSKTTWKNIWFVNVERRRGLSPSGAWNTGTGLVVGVMAFSAMLTAGLSAAPARPPTKAVVPTTRAKAIKCALRQWDMPLINRDFGIEQVCVGQRGSDWLNRQIGRTERVVAFCWQQMRNFA